MFPKIGPFGTVCAWVGEPGCAMFCFFRTFVGVAALPLGCAIEVENLKSLIDMPCLSFDGIVYKLS